jgi:uncharacterized surface protein with fasciclin (FAS1) repeats
MNAILRNLILSTTLAASALTAGAAFAENPMVGGAAMFPTKNIVENAVNSADHTTLVAAVQAAGLVDTLESKGPFTVFAPTNEAFAKLPKGTVETLLKPENHDMLVKILTCHVLSGAETSKMLADAVMKVGGRGQFTTVGGCKIIAWEKDGMFMLQDEKGDIATVTIADVMQSNGVIHVIDTVLLPGM